MFRGRIQRRVQSFRYMANGYFNSSRPQRESEPRMSNERNRDFGGSQGRGGGSPGRDSGEDALLELARLIGGNNSDPFAPEAPPPEQRAEPRLADVSRAAAAQSYDNRREPPVHGGNEGYGFDDRSQGRGHHDYPAHDDHDDHHGHHDQFGDFGDEFSEPEEEDGDGHGEPGRRPLRSIAVVLALAVFGTVGVWAWRTFSAGHAGDPPVIRADKSPTKITPMSDVKSDSRPGRGGEQVVRRDEDPVDVGNADGDAPDAGPPPLRGDPRRVRTVPIRADDGSSVPDRPAPRAAAAAMPPSPPSPASRAAAAPPQPAAPPPQRQAAVAPPPPADAGSSDAGAYMVQLTAVKTEGDAQSEFRRLQNKYSSVLGGRQPVIRRKDKGDQVYYAAGVGGFGAKGEAELFCEQLKAAGATCYVYKN